MSAGAAGAVAAAERDWQQVVDYFVARDALDRSKAIGLPSDHQFSRHTIATMLREGGLVDTGEGAYWLVHERAVARRAQTNERVRRFLTVLASAALVAAAVAVAALALLPAR